MKEIVLSLAIFISKCLSFFVSHFCLSPFSPLDIYTSNDRHCFWNGHVWPKKVALSPKYLGQKLSCNIERNDLRPIGRCPSGKNENPENHSILQSKLIQSTFIPVWILKVANCKIVTEAILQAVMSLVTLSQCWLVIFQYKWCINNIEIIQKTIWAKTISRSHISPQPIKRPQLFKTLMNLAVGCV